LKDAILIMNKSKEIERILPLLWKSYQHMYDSRVNTTQNNSNFLLIIISFFTIISVSFLTSYKQALFLIPLTMQIIALFILTKIFFLKSPIHWFQIDELLEDLTKKEFNEKLLADLKGLEEDTHIYLKESTKFVIFTLSLLILSVYFSAIIISELYFSPLIALQLSFVFISLLFIYLWRIDKQPKWKFTSSRDNVLKQIKEWNPTSKKE